MAWHGVGGNTLHVGEPGGRSAEGTEPQLRRRHPISPGGLVPRRRAVAEIRIRPRRAGVCGTVFAGLGKHRPHLSASHTIACVTARERPQPPCLPLARADAPSKVRGPPSAGGILPSAPPPKPPQGRRYPLCLSAKMRDKRITVHDFRPLWTNRVTAINQLRDGNADLTWPILGRFADVPSPWSARMFPHHNTPPADGWYLIQCDDDGDFMAYFHAESEPRLIDIFFPVRSRDFQRVPYTETEQGTWEPRPDGSSACAIRKLPWAGPAFWIGPLPSPFEPGQSEIAEFSEDPTPFPSNARRARSTMQM